MTALWFHSPVNQSTKLQGHQDDLGEIYIFYHLKSTTLRDQMVFICPPRDSAGNDKPHKDTPNTRHHKRISHVQEPAFS